MHVLLNLPDWSIGEGRSCPESRLLGLRFTAGELATRLRSLKAHPEALLIFRGSLWNSGEPVSRLSDDQVLERIRHLFATGRLHVCGRRPVRVVVDSDVKGETEEKPPERKPPETSDKTWIEIELLDEDDEPIAGERYRIVLPGGSVREGALNARGRARCDDIDPGTCEVSFPDRDAREWHAA